MLSKILEELKEHAPFTIFGAATGIFIISFFHRVPSNISYNIFVHADTLSGDFPP